MRAVLGTAMLLSSVEGGWQLNRILQTRMADSMKHATAPLTTVLRYSRATLWTAAFVITAAQLKHMCYQAAETLPDVSSSFESLSESFRRSLPRFPWKLRLGDTTVKDGNEAEVVCYDVNHNRVHSGTSSEVSQHDRKDAAHK